MKRPEPHADVPDRVIPGLGASIMFSGGSDSTLAAAKMLDFCERVTLFTCDPGFVLFLENSKVNAHVLVDRYGPERVEHKIVRIREAISKILFGEFRRDVCQYGFNLASLICLGCRLAMHAEAIIYNLEHNFPLIADGSIRQQATSPEQLMSVLQRNREFYRSGYGIQHASPIYDEDESDRIAYEIGITRVKGLKKQFILFDTQATCTLGVPADVYGRVFYGCLMGDQRERDSTAYLAAKHEFMEDYIAAHFRETGQDLATLVARNKALLEEHADAIRPRT